MVDLFDFFLHVNISQRPLKWRPKNQVEHLEDYVPPAHDPVEYGWEMPTLPPPQPPHNIKYCKTLHTHLDLIQYTLKMNNQPRKKL